MQYSLNYSGTRFLSTKIEITQFPGGFCFNFFDNLQGIFDQFLTFFIAKM